jgi:hypothetical protein
MKTAEKKPKNTAKKVVAALNIIAMAGLPITAGMVLSGCGQANDPTSQAEPEKPTPLINDDNFKVYNRTGDSNNDAAILAKFDNIFLAAIKNGIGNPAKFNDEKYINIVIKASGDVERYGNTIKFKIDLLSITVANDFIAYIDGSYITPSTDELAALLQAKQPVLADVQKQAKQPVKVAGLKGERRGAWERKGA